LIIERFQKTTFLDGIVRETPDQMDFIAVAQQCAPHVHVTTLSAIVRQESGYNPFAIGVVGGALVRQPRTKQEAVVTARALVAAGWNISVGISQVNWSNLAKYGLDENTAFDPCPNLRAGGDILSECYDRALRKHDGREQNALRAALSCYFSGNFSTGFRSGYVQSVVANSTKPAQKIRYLQTAAAGGLPQTQQSGR
jgi:type IV secretion system protein VirB1